MFSAVLQGFVKIAPGTWHSLSLLHHLHDEMKLELAQSSQLLSLQGNENKKAIAAVTCRRTRNKENGPNMVGSKGTLNTMTSERPRPVEKIRIVRIYKNHVRASHWLETDYEKVAILLATH